MAKTPKKKSPKKAKKIAPYKTRNFYLDDQPRTLFPLSTNRVLIENGESQILDHIIKIEAGEASFLPQKTVHAKEVKPHG